MVRQAFDITIFLYAAWEMWKEWDFDALVVLVIVWWFARRLL